MAKEKNEKTNNKSNGAYSLVYTTDAKDVKHLKITASPLTMKTLLKINEDLYTELLRLSNTLNARVGFLEGKADAQTMNQQSFNCHLLRLEGELFELKNKPWWKRFLGL